MKADENVASKECEEGKEKGEAAVPDHRAGEKSHCADGGEVPGMRSDAQGSAENNNADSEQRAIKQVFFLRQWRVHVAAFSISSSISQKTKPSRLTISPVRKEIGE